MRAPQQLPIALALCLAFADAQVAQARPAHLPGYKAMHERAGLVVIATPVERTELKEPTTIPGIRRGGEPIPAVTVQTTFSPTITLKGSLPRGAMGFVLHHLREVDPPEVRPNGPMLVDFTPNDGSQYLMFLVRREDGTYEAVDGQVDPACCIEKLQHKLPREEERWDDSHSVE